MDKQNMEVFGALLQGYTQACLNLNIIAGTGAMEMISGINVTQWYPLSKWAEIERIVIQSYENSDPIMLRVGMEMMYAWYRLGPGTSFIQKGVDFLYFQTGSEGYVSVVKGDPGEVGNFELSSIDMEKGLAQVYSTTLFNRVMECGVLIGGMLAPGDLSYVDVSNRNNKDLLEIEFH